MNSPAAAIKRGVLAVAAVLLLPAAASAGWARNWDSIRQAMSTVHSVSARFTQKKNLKILDRPLTSYGTFHYRAPGDLRWEYLSPIKDVLLVHGDNVAKYTWNGSRLARDRGPQIEATRVVMEQIASWLRGDFKDNRAFVPGLQPGHPVRVVLVPAGNSLKEFIVRVTLTLSDTPGVIASIEIAEPGGSSTVIAFSRVELNTDIPDSVFESVK